MIDDHGDNIGVARWTVYIVSRKAYRFISDRNVRVYWSILLHFVPAITGIIAYRTVTNFSALPYVSTVASKNKKQQDINMKSVINVFHYLAAIKRACKLVEVFIYMLR